MNAYEAVKTMLAVRNYQENEIPDDLVTRILQAGRLTGRPSASSPTGDGPRRNRSKILRRVGSASASNTSITGESFIEW